MRNSLVLLVCITAGARCCRAQQSVVEQARQAFQAGSAAYARGDLTGARRQFERAVRLAPGIEEGHSALGVVLFGLGEYQEAIAELQIALRMKPGDRTAEENLAQVYSQTGAPSQAAALFSKLDRESPLSGELLRCGRAMSRLLGVLRRRWRSCAGRRLLIRKTQPFRTMWDR